MAPSMKNADIYPAVESWFPSIKSAAITPDVQTKVLTSVLFEFISALYAILARSSRSLSAGDPASTISSDFARFVISSRDPE